MTPTTAAARAIAGSPLASRRLLLAHHCEVRLVYGLEEIEAQYVALDEALVDADVHRATLDTRRAFGPEVAHVTLCKDVQLFIARDPRPLAETVFADRLVLDRGGEDAGLLALTTGDAILRVDHSRARLWLDSQCIDRADGQAWRIRALDANVREEPPAVAEVLDD